MPGKRSANGGKIFEIFGEDPAGMARRLMEKARVADAIPPGARICLKPNLVVARPASEGATTHPEILSGIIEHLRDHGRREIEVAEGSWVGEDTSRAFSACGMAALAKRYGVRLYDLKKDETVERETPVGSMRLCRRAAEADFLVNVPVLKGHCQTRMTCALKNMKGCIPDSEKRRFHREGLHELIAALSTAVRQHLVVVDGICGDLDFEEGGNPVPAGRMLLGTDPVMIDALACALMGLAPADVEYLALAESHGVGTTAGAEEAVVRLNEPAPGSAARAAGKAAALGRRVKADQACSACFANVVHALKRLEEDGRGRKLPEIHVGQGWRGKEMPGLGIGRCCAGAGANVPGCPPSALDIVKALEEA